MKYLSIIIVLIGYCAFAQSEDAKLENFRMRAYKIDQSLRKNLSFQLDSVNVEFSEFQNKIEASNYFRYSRTGVVVEFYFEKNKLFYVVVKMYAPSSEHFWKENEFYIENNKIISENERFGQSAAAHGIALRKEALEDPYGYYGHNRKLNLEFFTTYIFELLDQIKNHR